MICDDCKASKKIKDSMGCCGDRLHNFKVAAEIQNCTPITALAGMMCKHTVSVYDLIQRQEKGVVIPQSLWDEKINDSINYLLVKKAKRFVKLFAKEDMKRIRAIFKNVQADTLNGTYKAMFCRC